MAVAVMKRAALQGRKKMCSAQCQWTGKSNRESCISTGERLLGVEHVYCSVCGRVLSLTSESPL